MKIRKDFFKLGDREKTKLLADSIEQKLTLEIRKHTE